MKEGTPEPKRVGPSIDNFDLSDHAGVAIVDDSAWSEDQSGDFGGEIGGDFMQVVNKKTRGGIVGARSKTTPNTGKPVPLTSEFQVRDMLLYKGGGYQHWPVQVSLVHDDKLDVVYCGTGETGTIS